MTGGAAGSLSHKGLGLTEEERQPLGSSRMADARGCWWCAPMRKSRRSATTWRWRGWAND